MTRTEVLIVGAGPTGLVLALWLTRLGVKGKLKKVTVKTTKTEPEALIMPTSMTGQNGAVITQNTKIAVTGCAKAKPKAKTATKKAKKARKSSTKRGAKS